MGGYSKIENYFLECYKDYPIVVQKKMEHLLRINVICFISWGLLIILRGLLSVEIPPLILMVDILGFVVIPLSLYLIRIKKPVLAGSSTISLTSLIFIHFIFEDLSENSQVNIYKVYETLVVLIVFFMFVALFALKKIQLLAYTIVALIMISAHYFIILVRWYGGSFSGRFVIGVLAECYIFIALISLVSNYMLSLTMKNPSKLIENIVFYKYTKKGPAPFFSEYPVDDIKLMNTAIAFYTGLNNLGEFTEGLFGPLPFDNEQDLQALVYSTIMQDDYAHDSRMENQNYVVIAFVLKKGASQLIEIDKFSDIICDSIKTIKNISDWNEMSLSKVIQMIRAR